MIRKIMVSGGIPIIDTQRPPKYLRIGRFNLSAIRYILGRINNVMKNAKARPNMMVHDKRLPEYCTITSEKYMWIQISK